MKDKAFYGTIHLTGESFFVQQLHEDSLITSRFSLLYGLEKFKTRFFFDLRNEKGDNVYI
jgi:hypothetical protein